MTAFVLQHSLSGREEGNYSAGLGYLSKRRPGEKIQFSSALLSLDNLRFAESQEIHLIFVHLTYRRSIGVAVLTDRICVSNTSHSFQPLGNKAYIKELYFLSPFTNRAVQPHQVYILVPIIINHNSPKLIIFNPQEPSRVFLTSAYQRIYVMFII